MQKDVMEITKNFIKEVKDEEVSTKWIILKDIYIQLFKDVPVDKFVRIRKLTNAIHHAMMNKKTSNKPINEIEIHQEAIGRVLSFDIAGNSAEFITNIFSEYNLNMDINQIEMAKKLFNEALGWIEKAIKMWYSAEQFQKWANQLLEQMLLWIK